MKKLLLAAAITLTATASFAGGMAEPVIHMDPTPIIETTTSSLGGSSLIGLIFIALVVAGLSAD